MIRITQLKVPITYRESELTALTASYLKLSQKQIEAVSLIRESLDARKKPQLFYVLSVDVSLAGREKAEKRILSDKRFAGKVIASPKPYRFLYDAPVREASSDSAFRSETEEKARERGKRPVIVGFGPAGMVAGYYLARAGLRPIILERGCDADQRSSLVEAFWKNGTLCPVSNVQFGEGGAGTFSDGKLNTLIKDKEGRCREILKLFVSMGAPEEILYQQKPHIGTDLLITMVKNIRNEIIKMGGEVRFQTRMDRLILSDGKISAVECVREEITEEINEQVDAKSNVQNNPQINQQRMDPAGIPADERERIETDTLVLAIGHSARDTFQMLYDTGIEMEAKSFAVGFRVIHPQSLIDQSQYGKQPDEILKKLGAANYKLTAKTSSGRGVYSFCMCPGGYVVNSSSENGYTVVNGMSYHGRSSGSANSAIIVSVTPEDFGTDTSPLSGIAFQKRLEEKAFLLADGKIPVETLGEFRQKKLADANIEMSDLAVKGAVQKAELHTLFPEEISSAFLEGMEQFGHTIEGFDAEDTPLLGIESRTSSPVRIPRNDDGQALIAGLYPTGEGAGYAGGIMSAAIDGLRTAEKICAAMTTE